MTDSIFAAVIFYDCLKFMRLQSHFLTTASLYNDLFFQQNIMCTARVPEDENPIDFQIRSGLRTSLKKCL